MAVFRVQVSQFASATRGVLQETQNIRVAYERTDAALGGVLPTAAGSWYKTGSLAANQFKRELSELKGGLTTLTNTFGSANAAIQGTLLPQYRAVLLAAGVSSSGNAIVLDESAAVVAAGQYTLDAFGRLLQATGDASEALGGLERSSAIAQHLGNLKETAKKTKARVEQSKSSFATYRASVMSFENEYAGRLDPTLFMPKDLLKGLDNGVKDTKGAFGILKHAFSLGSTAGKMIGTTWEPSSTKPFMQGFSSKMGDWARPTKWQAAWETVKSPSVAVPEVSDDVGGALSGASKATAARWGERLDAAGKVVGYVGDGLAVFGIATSAVRSYTDESGDAADKAAAATYAVVSGSAKFATGKAVGAAVGTAVGGPVGTAVGFLAGCAVDFIWDKASDAMESSGAKDAIIDAVGSAYREVGGFLKRGFDCLVPGNAST